ncbi:hypothetical protein SRB5_40400 [Streptomyces sp. RB5]|uniref:Hydrolase n=1 Tax=Streptomyces smaragdinus TaxID=2585196 RepID=A0A7K0CM78_9ACTN|nr:hypothetical protein [Streptomyces smaragdinus]
MIKGIDVSNHQSTFPTGGFDFCIMKATEGRTYTDPRQSAHARRARSAGLVVGFYHFLWPGNIAAQARYFVDKCVSREGDVLACDWERTSDGTAATCAEKDAFLREVKRLRPDHRVLLYCSTDFWLNRDTTSFAGDGLWVAHYGVPAGKPGIRAEWLIHQYTSRPLDTNVARFASRAAMRAWAQEDDMPLTDTDAKKVWNTDFVKAPVENPDNPTWTPASYLRDTNLRARAVQEKLADLTEIELTAEQITALAAALAEHPGLVDQLAEKIAEKVAARLASVPAQTNP